MTRTRRRRSAGFSLLELLLVVAIVGILAALVLPSSQPSLHEQLQAAARLVATDLAYGRSLAISNNSTYRFTFDIPQNRYTMQHSGSNHSFDTLPYSPFRSPGDPPTQHILDFDDLPHAGPPAALLVVASSGASLARITSLEFGPLGSTTASTTTVLWLSAGSGADARYITISVNPVTGLADVGPFTTDGPPVWLLSN
jgi:type IV pilus assembly protein PilE